MRYTFIAVLFHGVSCLFNSPPHPASNNETAPVQNFTSFFGVKSIVYLRLMLIIRYLGTRFKKIHSVVLLYMLMGRNNLCFNALQLFKIKTAVI